MGTKQDKQGVETLWRRMTIDSSKQFVIRNVHKKINIWQQISEMLRSMRFENQHSNTYQLYFLRCRRARWNNLRFRSCLFQVRPIAIFYVLKLRRFSERKFALIYATAHWSVKDLPEDGFESGSNSAFSTSYRGVRSWTGAGRHEWITEVFQIERISLFEYWFLWLGTKLWTVRCLLILEENI